jgi:hypothetical protein
LGFAHKKITTQSTRQAGYFFVINHQHTQGAQKMNETIAVKIDFLHDARPYMSADEYSNIVVSFPQGALPNTGDIIQIDGIRHPEGSFVVSHRVFSVSTQGLNGVSLTLGIEGK